jgi:hypothetical protein
MVWCCKIIDISRAIDASLDREEQDFLGCLSRGFFAIEED